LGGYKQLSEGDLASLIALTSGQAPTPQMQSGCPQYRDGCFFPTDTLSLPDQLLAKGLRWRAYVESEGQACRSPAADAGDEYTTRHNPFVYYRSLTELGECASNDLPIDGLANDLKSATDTPNFAFIQPNLCHGGFEDPCADGSAGGLPAADAFLANLAPQILDSPAYKTDGLLVLLTPTGALFVSPLLPTGASDQTAADPYSVLHYIEDVFGLDYLAKAKDAVPLTLAIPRAPEPARG
jgi:hypothetical protein